MIDLTQVVDSVARVFPHTASGWAGLIGQSVAIAGVVFGALWYVFRLWLREQLGELRTQVNGVGERVTKSESSCTEHGALIATLEKKQQASEFDRAALHEAVGRVAGAVATNTGVLNAMKETQHERDKVAGERLAKIEQQQATDSARAVRMEQKLDLVLFGKEKL